MKLALFLMAAVLLTSPLHVPSRAIQDGVGQPAEDYPPQTYERSLSDDTPQKFVDHSVKKVLIQNKSDKKQQNLSVHPGGLPFPHPDGVPFPHPDGVPFPHPDGVPFPHPDGVPFPHPGGVPFQAEKSHSSNKFYSILMW